MSELTDTLFEFLSKHYIHGIIQDLEYEKAVGYAEAKQELLSSQLDEEQRSLLKGMLDEISLAHHMEQRRLLRATLSLTPELSRLVG